MSPPVFFSLRQIPPLAFCTENFRNFICFLQNYQFTTIPSYCIMNPYGVIDSVRPKYNILQKQ